MARVAVAIFLLAGVSGGYKVYQHLHLTPHLLSPQSIAQAVGGTYGDPHPHIVKVVSTQTDGASQEPMYDITVTGHFQNRKRTARYLEFSALATRQYVWGLWAGNSPPGPKVHRAWFVEHVPLGGLA